MKETSFDIDFLGSRFTGFYVQSIEIAQQILSKLMLKDCLFGLDTETCALPKYKGVPNAALSPHLGRIRLLQICDGENSFVFDLYHLPIALFTEFLQAKRFVAHNALFDLKFLRHAGIEGVNLGCTMLAYIMLVQALYSEDEVGEKPKATLKEVTSQFLNTDILKAMGNSDWSIQDLTYEQILYSAVDAICVLKIAEKLSKGLDKHGLFRYYNLVKDALYPISEIELNGVGFDLEHHKTAVCEWRDDLVKAKKEVLELTQLSEITDHTMAAWLTKTLDERTLALWPRTDTGKLKTDTHAFTDFSYLEIVKPFAAYKKKLTLCSTFGMNLISHINTATGRIHPSYFLCGARTGRLSSSKPNGQNMPRDKTVRSSFVAAPGNVLICADYGQVELRCAAEISRDATMLAAYRDGIDLHRLTASKVSHKPLSEVTDEERQMAKAINFGLLFGLGAKKFAHYAKKSYGVEVSQSESYEAVEIFRETYSGYREWQLQQANTAEITKKCTTPCGKLRKLPDESTFGNSMNHPVQGGAAEVMLSALVRVYQACKESVWWEPGKVKLVGTVHDEILLECESQYKEVAGTVLKTCMIEGYLDVFPEGITRDLVEAGAGKNWADAKSKENKLTV